MSDEQLLTVEQVAKQMQVHVETVRVWIRRGELVAINIGNEYRITRADLNDFLERRKPINARIKNQRLFFLLRLFSCSRGQ